MFQSFVGLSSHLLDLQSLVGLSSHLLNFEGSSHFWTFQSFVDFQSFVELFSYLLDLSVICWTFSHWFNSEGSSHLLNFSVIYKIRECTWPRPQVQRSPQGQEPQGVPEVHEFPPVPHRQKIWFGGNHGGGRYHIYPETLQRI